VFEPRDAGGRLNGEPAAGRAGVNLLGVQLVREGRVPYAGGAVRGPAQAAQAVRALLEERDRETVAVLLLDVKHRPLGVSIVAQGTLTGCQVHPREVFKVAVLANAAAMILAHNHPSGDCTPSREDRALFVRLQQAGRLLGIEVLDHLVIGADNAWSSCGTRAAGDRADEEGR